MHIKGVCDRCVWTWADLRQVHGLMAMTLYRQHIIMSPVCFSHQLQVQCLLVSASVLFMCQWDVDVNFSLCFHSCSCLLMCYLQKGVTPVMLAAFKGHTGVVDLLVHKYNCSLTEVATVSVFDVLGCQSSLGVSCQCLCLTFSVECHSACSQHLCRMYVCGRHFARTIKRWMQNFIVRTFKSIPYILASNPGAPAYTAHVTSNLHFLRAAV